MTAPIVELRVGHPRPLRALLQATEDSPAWRSTLLALRSAVPQATVVLGASSGDGLGSLAEAADEVVDSTSLEALIAREAARGGAHLLVVRAPVELPSDLLARALTLIEGDLRCSSVSFLSNAAGYASFLPGAAQLPGRSAQQTTELLRGEHLGLEPVAVPYPVGPVVLLSAQGLSIVRPFPLHEGRLLLSLADFGASARARGLLDLLEPSTYIEQAVEAGDVEADLSADDASWLDAAHPGIVASARQVASAHSAVGEALAVARARIEGLRIIVDGSCLMPQEMGTQVAFLEQVEALAERDDVAYLGVALAGPVPPYAQRILSSPKVDARLSNLDTLEGFPEVDVVYRSFQVTPGIDPGRWRVRGRRIVTAIQDLIAYEIPGYQDRAEDWFEYRATMKHACSVVDGVVTISQHTADTVSLERLGVDPSRVFVVPDGIGHLSGDEEVVQPQGLLELGFAGEAFLLVLGTNYSHKNRDLAISVVRELQLRGRKLSLVLAGASVPRGSSGAAEEAQRAPGDGVIVLSDVSSAERNWLFRHAELVLYPTGAEGFGFVPHEAAAFGTPTVMVPIPALAERMPSLPVAPRDWSTAALADACEEILSDPAIAAAQIKAIESGEADFNWQRSAGLLLDVFRSLLARPAVASL